MSLSRLFCRNGGAYNLVKVPCELTVFYVLPCIRKELAMELVKRYHFSQADVARMFGVTDATISHYMKSRRGSTNEIVSSGRYEEFKLEVEKSAKRLTEGSSSVTEICLLCRVIKGSCMMADIYKTYDQIEIPVYGYEK